MARRCSTHKASSLIGYSRHAPKDIRALANRSERHHAKIVTGKQLLQKQIGALTIVAGSVKVSPL